MTDPKYAALCAKHERLLAKANKVQAEIDAFVEAAWQASLSDMDRERMAASRAEYFGNVALDEIEAEAMASADAEFDALSEADKAAIR